MGVESWSINVSTPSLALPLQGGGDFTSTAVRISFRAANILEQFHSARIYFSSGDGS